MHLGLQREHLSREVVDPPRHRFEVLRERLGRLLVRALKLLLHVV